ncbi:MAG: FAD synthetase family protein [Puniceicoccales bacterium]|jgi:riboflavin kinase/FMN adenylyltransferase|nr:FAD synthetase family protein [Puniceicoccales bacterium]
MVGVVETFFDGEVCDFTVEPLCMSIGTFDGVHLGHRKLISTAVEQAKVCNGIAAAYTFRPHPTAITHPDVPKTMIYSFEEKYKILESFSLAHIIEQKFDGQFSKLSPEDFIAFLRKKFPTLCGICVGENFKFGHNRGGNAKILMDCAEKFSIAVTIVPSLVMDGERVSSSRIRELLRGGDTAKARVMLGR